MLDNQVFELTDALGAYKITDRKTANPHRIIMCSVKKCTRHAVQMDRGWPFDQGATLCSEHLSKPRTRKTDDGLRYIGTRIPQEVHNIIANAALEKVIDVRDQAEEILCKWAQQRKDEVKNG